MLFNLIKLKNAMPVYDFGLGFGLFVGGKNKGSAYVGRTDANKYEFATEINTMENNFLPVWRFAQAAAGNTEFAIFMGGYYVNPGTTRFIKTKNTTLHSYGSDTRSDGAELTIERASSCAAGNHSVAIIYAGHDWLYVVKGSVNKYTYSSFSMAAGESLANGFLNHAGVGTADFALFAGGEAGGLLSISRKHIFSSDAKSTGTNLGRARHSLTAVTNPSYAFFSGGYTVGQTAYTDKYTYTGDIVAPGSMLGLARCDMASAGNREVGVMAAGTTSNASTVALKYIDRFVYASNAHLKNVHLDSFAERNNAIGASSMPGGL